MKSLTFIHATLITLTLTASASAVAGVQFRISHETSSNEYVVYMTPDAVPTPDMVLSAQVSVVVPRSTDGNGFVINSLKSAVKGINWINHSQVKAPTEPIQSIPTPAMNLPMSAGWVAMLIPATMAARCSVEPPLPYLPRLFPLFRHVKRMRLN